MQNTQPANTNTNMNEFYALWKNLAEDVQPLTEKYPVCTAISIVAFAVLGISGLLSFSISGIISSAVLVTLGVVLGLSIRNNSEKFWEALKASLSNMKLSKS